MRPLKNNSRAGFTLIEMAMVVMIIGIVIASMTPLYKQYTEKQRLETTSSNINAISSAIGSFRSVWGRYPCPASLTAQRGNPLYGREDCTNLRTGPSATAAGSCNNGICVEQSTRANINYMYPAVIPPVTTSASPRVLVGTVPFRQLNLDEENGYDGFGDRITYVVTEHLTCADCFQSSQGGIAILDQTGASIIAEDAAGETATAHFLVISHGENGSGAYTKNGVRLACPAAGIERENCDFIDQPDATYQLSESNSSSGVNNYDDVITYFTQNEVPLWQVSTAVPQSIHQKATGDVAVSPPSMVINNKGWVGGAVRARDDAAVVGAIIKTPGAPDGKIGANNLCSAAGTSCFPTELIAGVLETVYPIGDPNDDDLECPPGEFMTGISHGRATCTAEVVSICPPDTFVKGFNADGSLNCDLANCLAAKATICSADDVDLPATIHGQTYTTPTIGDSVVRTYLCDNGAWLEQSTVGECTCTPSTTTSPLVPCGSGFGGDMTVTTTVTCPGSVVTTTADTSGCTCLNLTETIPLPCPDGYINNGWQIQRDHYCTGTGDWTDWVFSGSCDCAPQPSETRPIACGGDLSGTKIQQRNWVCPTGWTDWADIDISECHCEAATLDQTDACPPGYVGGIAVRNERTCSGGVPSWSGFIPVPGGNTCVLAPVVHYQWSPIGSGTQQTIGIGEEEGDDCSPVGSNSACYRPLGGGQYQNYPSCVCE